MKLKFFHQNNINENILTYGNSIDNVYHILKHGQETTAHYNILVQVQDITNTTTTVIEKKEKTHKIENKNIKKCRRKREAKKMKKKQYNNTGYPIYES